MKRLQRKLQTKSLLTNWLLTNLIKLLDQVNKVPSKENPAKEPTAAEPELEVILIEDELIDSAREPQVTWSYPKSMT